MLACLAARSQLNKGAVHRKMQALGMTIGASRDYMAKMRQDVRSVLDVRDAPFSDYRTGGKP